MERCTIHRKGPVLRKTVFGEYNILTNSLVSFSTITKNTKPVWIHFSSCNMFENANPIPPCSFSEIIKKGEILLTCAFCWQKIINLKVAFPLNHTTTTAFDGTKSKWHHQHILLGPVKRVAISSTLSWKCNTTVATSTPATAAWVKSATIAYRGWHGFSSSRAKGVRTESVSWSVETSSWICCSVCWLHSWRCFLATSHATLSYSIYHIDLKFQVGKLHEMGNRQS